MSDTIQNRPMNGGLPVVCGGSGTSVHTCDALPESKGGPMIDEITLWLCNKHTAAQIASVSIGSGVAILVSLPALSTTKVLDKHPVRTSGAAISVANTSGDGEIVAYGSFTRS